jgi:hypothetical protein
MMIDENELRALLDAADIPPSTVVPSVVVEQGRRRVVRRRAASAAGGFALTATLVAAVGVPMMVGRHHTNVTTTHPAIGAPATPSPVTPTAPPATVCTPTALKTGSDIPKLVNINVIDPSGRFIVGFQSSDTVYKSVLYTDGVPKVLHLPGRMASVDAINASGMFAGITTIGADGNEKVYRYTNGTYTILKVPMGGTWHPYEVGMNASGAIVAQEEPSGNSGGEGAVNLLWRPGSDMAIKLPMPKGSGLTGIADNGDIVGGGPGHADGTVGDATVWDPNGRNGHKLASAPGDSPIADEATGLYAAGGTYVQNSDVNWNGAAVWNVVTGEETVYSPDGPILSVNGSGDAIDAAGNVFLNGAKPTLQPLKPDQEIHAGLIANNGIIAGMSGDTNVVWHC